MKKIFLSLILAGFFALSACGMLSQTEEPTDTSSGSASSVMEDVSSVSDNDSSADTGKEVIISPTSDSDRSSVKEEPQSAASSEIKSDTSEQDTPSVSGQSTDSKPVPAPVTPEEKPVPAPTPEEKPEPEPDPVPDTDSPESAAYDYVLNTNTMKFHFPSCSSVDTIKPENRADFCGSRDDVIKQGFKPCGKCHP